MTEWTKCKSQRPPNEKGKVRLRISAHILGLSMTAEWSEEMHLCGMGFADSEWWPLKVCHWDGYRRYFTGDYEWRPVEDGDPDGVTWHGLDLLPCPFTGKPPTVTYHGRWIGAPPDKAQWLSLRSHLVDSTGWTDAAKMRDAWNMRSDAMLEARKR